MAKSIINIEKDLVDALGKIADKKGINKSTLLGDILENVGVGKDNIKSVVLQIPVELLNNNKALLKTWLEQKSAGIVNIFYPE